MEPAWCNVSHNEACPCITSFVYHCHLWSDGKITLASDVDITAQGEGYAYLDYKYDNF